jgi:hypothetical protein
VAIDAMRRNVAKARAAVELRGTDESAEIQAELRLEMKANELRAAVQRNEAVLPSIAKRTAKYKSLYLRNVAKQRKIESSRRASERLMDMEGERHSALELFRQRIRNEQARVQQDIETIRKMREDLLRPPPQSPKKSARQQYLDLLREAGQVASDDEPVPGGGDSLNSALMFEDSDDEKKPTRQSARDEDDAVQIAFLENNIKTLLATGNYGENDPIIVRLRSQIADIVARRIDIT